MTNETAVALLARMNAGELTSEEIVRSLLERWPKRIIGLRIHETQMMPQAGGPIKNRDMKDPGMLACWKTMAAMACASRCIPYRDRPPTFAGWQRESRMPP